MNLEQILSTVWRRKLLFATTLVASIVAIVAITLSLPKTYKATATLFVGVNKEASKALAFDTALGEQLVRTYTTLAANPNTADAVLERLDGDMTRTELLGKMSFAPIERTQLLEISAEAGSPEEAQLIADTYAGTFKDRVDEQFERGDTQTKIAVSEPASLPTSASKPNPPLYIGLGSVLSAFIALGVVLLRERIEDPLLTQADESQVLGHPIVGRIPEIDWSDRSDRQRARDAFELLKVNVEFATENRSQTLLVTSPRPVEGKSSVAIELATVCADHGERTVVVECDLRRPGLVGTTGAQGVDGTSMGVANYLAGTAPLSAILASHRERGFDLIWAGPIPPNPSGLLQSQRFDRLLEELRTRFDRIIIDSPPISVGADVSLLVPRADAVLYVVDARTARRAVTQAGINQLVAAKARRIGVVLNRARSVGEEGYEYYAATLHAAPATRERSRSTVRS